MSLITLTSKDSPQAYNFDSYFPQPIKIDRHSQVCVLKFIHFRSDKFIINNTNDTLLFVLGNGKNDAQREVKLLNGTYTPADLATHITTRMNAVLQQQNFVWSCTYDISNEKFTISYTFNTTPSASGGDFVVKQSLSGTAEVIEEDPSLTETTLRITGADQEGVFILNRGIYMNVGSIRSQGTRFIRQDDASETGATNYEGKLTAGKLALVRNARSFEDFDESTLDISFESGLITTTDDDGSLRILRDIPDSAFETGTPYAITNKSQVLNTIFRPKATILQGENMKVIYQMEVSIDGGATFIPMTTSINDRTGSAYFRTYSDPQYGVATFPATFFVSSDQDFYDDDSATQVKFCSARCPYKPVITFDSAGEETNMTFVDFLSGASPEWDGTTSTNRYGFGDYSAIGTNPNIGFIFSNSVTSANYYTSKVPTNSTDVLTYDVYDDDSVPLPAPIATLTYNPTTGVITTSSALGTDTTFNYAIPGAVTLPIIRNNGSTDIITQGILNEEDHPISKQEAEYLDVSEDEIIVDNNVSYTAGDLAKTSQIFVGRLTDDDVANFSGSPAFITKATLSGDMELTLGATERIYVGTKSTGQDVFVSNTSADALGRSSTLHISIAELPAKSYEGGKSNVGKSIAVLPREEFKGSGSETGRLAYVADFENWIDLSNASDLYLNQFKVEIRNEDGTLAKDLVPESMLQIKIRKNPDVVQREMMEKVMMDSRRPPVKEQDIAYVGS